MCLKPIELHGMEPRAGVKQMFWGAGLDGCWCHSTGIKHMCSESSLVPVPRKVSSGCVFIYFPAKHFVFIQKDFQANIISFIL